MNRGVDHQAVFFADVDRLAFGERLAWIAAELGVTTLAYCLMGNHFHLLLRAPAGVLSGAMQNLASVYTRRTNDRLGRDGPLFRGRFHSIPVETDRYLAWVTRYIHLNPVGLPGVATPRDHRWSSYRSYLGLRPVPAFVDVEPVLELFEGRREALASFTESADAAEGPVAGEDVRRLVACAVAVDEIAHPSDHGARHRLDRTVLILLVERCTDPHLRRGLTAALGPRSSEARKVAVRRAERRLDDDPVVGRVLAWIAAELPPGCLAPAAVRATEGV